MNAIVKSERVEESDEDEDSQDSHDSDEELEVGNKLCRNL